MEKGQGVLQDRHPATAEMEWKRRNKALNYPCVKSGAEAAGYGHRWDLELQLERRWRKKAAILFREFSRIFQNISSLALGHKQREELLPSEPCKAFTRAAFLLAAPGGHSGSSPKDPQVSAPAPNPQLLHISAVPQDSCKIQWCRCEREIRSYLTGERKNSTQTFENTPSLHTTVLSLFHRHFQ